MSLHADDPQTQIKLSLRPCFLLSAVKVVALPTKDEKHEDMALGGYKALTPGRQYLGSKQTKFFSDQVDKSKVAPTTSHLPKSCHALVISRGDAECSLEIALTGKNAKLPPKEWITGFMADGLIEVLKVNGLPFTTSDRAANEQRLRAAIQQFQEDQARQDESKRKMTAEQRQQLHSRKKCIPSEESPSFKAWITALKELQTKSESGYLELSVCLSLYLIPPCTIGMPFVISDSFHCAVPPCNDSF